MKRVMIPFITAALLLALSASAVHAKSAAELLREGLYAEEIEGNLDTAIGIYQQIILDTTAPQNLVAQALYRQGMCFLKKKDEAKAREVLQKLVNEYPDQTDIVEKARPILEGLGNADPASLMPPETILYVEIGSPGQQVATILRMLKGTALENPLSVMGMKNGSQAAGGRGKNPAQMLSAFLNPNMLAELEKVRGIGVGIQDIGKQQPSGLIVLYPGQSNTLKGLLQMAFTGLGSETEVTEGMTMVKFADGGGAAFDGTVTLVATPSPRARDLLQWSIRQYKGRAAQPSLASANKSFARISRQARQQNALTLWLNADEAYARLLKVLPANQIPPQMRTVDGLADLKNIDDLIATLSLRETGLALEASVGFKAGYQSLAYNMIHTPNLNKANLQVVPAEAVALLSLTLGANGTPQAQAASEKIRSKTGLDLGADIFGNIQQISLFLVPPKEAVLVQGPGVPPIARSIGLAVTSRDPERTHRLLMTLLQTANLAAPETQQPPTGTGRYEIALAHGMKLFGYSHAANQTMVLSLNSQLVEQSLAATRQDLSVLSGGPLQEALATLSPTTSKLVLVNVGTALQLAAQNVHFPSEEATRQAQQLLQELTAVSQKTTIRLLTSETADSFGVRLSISDLPPLNQILEPVGQLAQMLKGQRRAISTQAPAAPPINIPQAGRAPTIDGQVDDAWADIPSHGIRSLAYTPASSEADLSASFKTMYDRQGLYFLVDVTDDSLMNDSVEFWLDDSIEIFLDTDNDKSGTYGERDYQYHFAWDSTAPTMGETRFEKTGGVQFAFARTDKGYVAEILLPWSTLGIQSKAGARIGFDVHVNDDDDGGDRDTKLMWHGQNDIAWQHPSALGTGELAGLVGWWKMDESEGTKAADSSGNGLDAKVRGAPTWQPAGGKVGGALQLDGADDYTDTGCSTDLATWTVAVWVKSPAAPASAEPSGPVHREKNFQINWNHAADEFRGAAAVCTRGVWHGAGFGDLQADTWYHLAATFDGNGLKAYKNGALVTTNSEASGVPDTETETLKLGRHARDNQCFAGTIDEARVYNFALTEAQIRQLCEGR